MGEISKEARNAAISAVVGAVALGALEWFTGALSALWGGLVALCRFLAEWVAYSTVPAWGAVLLAVPAVVGLLRIVSLVRARRPRPEWESKFCAMDFEGMRWTWTWRRGHPVNLECFCPGDMMELRPADERRSLRQNAPCWRMWCQKCDQSYGEGWSQRDGATYDVVFEIERLVRTGEWRKLPRVSVPRAA